MSAEITCSPNGPLVIKGEVTLLDAEGRPFNVAGRPAIALCRCGHSANKPFCDGQHKAKNFESKVSAT